MGPRATGGWGGCAGRAGAPAPGRTCLLPLLLCAALRSLRASPGSEGEQRRSSRDVGAATREWLQTRRIQFWNILGEMETGSARGKANASAGMRVALPMGQGVPGAGRRR